MAIGDIGSIIDTLEFDTDRGDEPDIIHISGNVYLIAYRGGAGPDGLLKTVTIESNGTIGSIIDTLQFETLYGLNPILAHISGDVYIVGFQGTDNDGWLKTFNVDSDGNFGAIIDTEEIDTAYGRNFRFYHLGGTVWLVAYQDASDGWLKTLNIGNDGIFGAYVDTQKYDTTLGAFPALVHIAGDVFAIAYSGPDEDGWLKTWEVQSNGTIAAAMIDSLEFDADYAHSPQMRLISGDVYAIAYKGPPGSLTGYGYIKTLTIADDGTIGAIIDTFQYTHGLPGSVVSAIILVAEEVYALAYTGFESDGYLVTVTIHNNGQIDEPLVDELEFDTNQGSTPAVVHIAGNTYAIAYGGVDGDGFLITVPIETLVVVAPTVSADPATSVSTNSATLNGTLDNDGGEACDCGFQWGETVAYGNTTPTQSRTTGQTFSQAISGLTPGTTYHFRAFATNAAGTSYGADRTFTTLVAASSVTTDPATGLIVIAAILNGTLNQDGGEACECGFEWGETVAYGETTPTESKTTGEAFSQVIGGSPNTTYHFRAFATNSVGTSYGVDRSFATAAVISKAFALAREEL